jgi:hypothetical protein
MVCVKEFGIGGGVGVGGTHFASGLLVSRAKQSITPCLATASTATGKTQENLVRKAAHICLHRINGIDWADNRTKSLICYEMRWTAVQHKKTIKIVTQLVRNGDTDRQYWYPYKTKYFILCKWQTIQTTVKVKIPPSLAGVSGVNLCCVSVSLSRARDANLIMQVTQETNWRIKYRQGNTYIFYPPTTHSTHEVGNAIFYLGWSWTSCMTKNSRDKVFPSF